MDKPTMKRLAINCLLVLIVSASSGHAGTAPLEHVIYSPDITLELAGLVVSDENAALDDLNGIVIPEDIGMIPGNADLSLFHRYGNGDVLLAFDITIELPGTVIAAPSDVVRRSGGTYSIEFDGSAEGVPSGARLDALSVDGNGHLLLSFDTTVVLSGITAADEDVVLFDGADFSLLFDGSAAGLSQAVDLDALHFAPDSGLLYLSFDVGGEVGSVNFRDEDLLVHNPMSASWQMAYDGSAEHATWVAGDLDAAFVGFLAGFLFKDGFENK
jgi:hypothetical protein